MGSSNGQTLVEPKAVNSCAPPSAFVVRLRGRGLGESGFLGVGTLWLLCLLGAGCDGRDGADSALPTEVCDDALDNDGDGYLDCDDQDCWSVSVCDGNDDDAGDDD
ncbi:MAG TPA: hypothetical protein DIU15_14810, partial [Deltaproteobacteria bacterium]|nr:hypothetical protein [Deltaproteobacteria bacterium]